MKPLNVAATGLARRQHQLITVPQLEALGLSRRQVASHIARGQLCDLGQGVLRIGGANETWESQLFAAVLACGRRAHASHRSAAVLWGSEGIGRCTPEITAPAAASFRRNGIWVHERADISHTTLTVRSGIPVSLAGRTLLDLTTVVSPDEVRLALRHALRTKLTNPQVLRLMLEEHDRQGHDGADKLRAILAEISV